MPSAALLPPALVKKTPPGSMNPTFYYATAFFQQDGYSILEGTTVNTLAAGP